MDTKLARMYRFFLQQEVGDTYAPDLGRRMYTALATINTTRRCLLNAYTLHSQALFGTLGLCGMNGSITMASMVKVFHRMKLMAGFSEKSTLVDVGAGYGRWA